MAEKTLTVNSRLAFIVLASAALVLVGVLPEQSKSGGTDKWIVCDRSSVGSTKVMDRTYYCCGGGGTVQYCQKADKNYFEDRYSLSSYQWQTTQCSFSDANSICRSSAYRADCRAPSQCNGVAAGTESTTCSFGNANRIDVCSDSCEVSDGSCESSCPGYTGDATCDGKKPGESCGTAGQCDESCKCAACKDTDGGNKPKTAGRCTGTDGVAMPDACGAGNVITEYYCSGNSCASATKDCDSYDDYYCTASGSSLDRNFENWDCTGDTPAKCDYDTSTVNTYACDLSAECIPRTCEGTIYRCYYSNAGSYQWAASYPAIESACADGHDNDCDGVADCDDTDCADSIACGGGGCTPGTCDIAGRRFCLSNGVWSEADAAEYCANCDYCSDGVKSCDEDDVDCGGPLCMQCSPEDFIDDNTFEYTLYRRWNLISSPFASITDVVIDSCGATSGNFYFYDGSARKWDIGTVGIKNIKKGISYWFYVANEGVTTCKVRIKGTGAAAYEDISVHAGWSQVGSPKEGLAYAKSSMNTACKDCADSACTSMDIRGWNPVSQSFVPAASLQSGRGYFVQCVD